MPERRVGKSIRMSLEPGLARLIAARLCHDLGGVVGTLAGTLDLVEPGDPGMHELARESAQVLRHRLRLYSAAWGGGASDLDAAGLTELLQGAPASPRVRFALDRMEGGGLLPAALVPIALNAALLAAEALPRGGTVHLGGSAARGLHVWPDGASAAWPQAVISALSGMPEAELLEGGPRRVLLPLLLAFAEEVGWTPALSLGGEWGSGCALLSLTPA